MGLGVSGRFGGEPLRVRARARANRKGKGLECPSPAGWGEGSRGCEPGVLAQRGQERSGRAAGRMRRRRTAGPGCRLQVGGGGQRAGQQTYTSTSTTSSSPSRAKQAAHLCPPLVAAAQLLPDLFRIRVAVACGTSAGQGQGGRAGWAGARCMPLRAGGAPRLGQQAEAKSPRRQRETQGPPVAVSLSSHRAQAAPTQGGPFHTLPTRWVQTDSIKPTNQQTVQTTPRQRTGTATDRHRRSDCSARLCRAPTAPP